MAIGPISTSKPATLTPEELATMRSYAENWARGKLQHDDGVMRNKVQDLIKATEDEDDVEPE